MVLLATSSLTFDGFENNNHERLFESAAKLGYKRVEFNCWYAETLTPGRIREMKRRCENTGVQPIALHVSAIGGGTSELLALNTAHKIRAIEAAVELGCRRVVASGTDNSGNLSDIVRELDNIAPIAEDADVLLSLENHCNNILAGSDDYQFVMDRITSEHVGICIDGGHLEAAGEEIGSFIESFYPRINHIHLKENKIFGQKTFCRFGSGGTDNNAMIEKMLEKGYNGYMSVELSPEVGEWGEFVPFTDDDRRKALEMFSKYESL
ncbi:MAG TPA: sugar phosphate isomerase/epimerase [Candidatus Pelethocola excrementipullorum]|nr:sugar phosphate isomerase/epimerase [Candidatus Pelethocola excrementipullorum]